MNQRAGVGALRATGDGDRHSSPAGRDGWGLRLRLEEVGCCLVGSVGGSQKSSARAVAQALVSEDERIAVVMPLLTSAIIPELVSRLRPWVPIKWDSVRLVSAGAAALGVGAAGPGRPVAQELADGLGVEVIAPDGDVVCVPGGSLFIRSGNGRRDSPDGDHGAWWRFRPGRDPQPQGRRFPEPEWERHLAAVSGAQLGHLAGILVQEIPCGLWVRRPGPVPSTDLVFAVPVHPSATALVVSRPGDPPLRPADVRQLIEALPPPLRERLVLIPYGDDPVEDARLGEIGSEAANQTLRVRTGLPLELAGRGRHVVSVTGQGAPGWRPFAVELAWRPYGGARVHSWLSPADNLLPLGPGQLALNDRWMVEVVEAGLWIREIDRVDGATLVRELPLDSEYCTVVVGAPDPRQERPPWRLIVRLLRQLPPDARHRLRLAVPEQAGQRFARATAKVQATVAEGHIWLVVGGKRLVPLPRPSHYPWEEVDGDDPFPLKSEEDGDAVRLLSFVDELRRTPAWDEEPSYVDAGPPNAGRAGDRPDERRAEPTPTRAQPTPTRAQPTPTGPQPTPTSPQPTPRSDPRQRRRVTVEIPDHIVRDTRNEPDSTIRSRGRRSAEPERRFDPRSRWNGETPP
jgi:hypothetical protein